MPDIFYLLRKWWKQILGVLLLSLITAGLIVFLKRPEYLSATTAVPASVVSTDKARIFNENIDELYSNLGTPDDLDMIVGTGQLDTIYLAVTDQFNLYDHYRIKEEKEKARIKAADLLKYNTKVEKSGYGELQVKVWDTDKNLAPQLANALMEELKTIHQQLQNANNQASLDGLHSAIKKVKAQMDSTKENSDDYKALSDRLQQYDKLVSEYQLMIDSKPPALIVVEKARVSLLPDKPKRLQVLIATAILSLLFALLLALVLERRKTVSK